MIAKNATDLDLERAAALTGVALQDLRPKGRGWAFTLTLAPSSEKIRNRPYARKGFMRRKDGERRPVHAVCWHGHRDFFRKLFEYAPDAEIRSAMAIYRGSEHFEATTQASDRNIGSQMDPMYASEACWCEE